MTETSDRADNLSPLKRAVLEIRELRSRLDQTERARREPIAIVGMGMRLPGGISDPDAFWALLRDGGEAIGPIPPERWDSEAFYDPDYEAPGKMYTRYGAFVTQVDQFDPQFFGISPREAASMDPQQRLLLETAWEALERAGQAPDQLYGTQTGVFIGIANSDYFRMLASDIEAIDVYLATGNTLSVAAGRISYLLGLHGPSMAIDTACSSSLVAVHLAAQSLRSGECDLALAGGVNLILSPEGNINFSKAQMMARDGHCKTFDATADGYVRGEGCAVIVLKRLSDAQAANDDILAVIRGSAINQDGRSSGLTAPNGPAQEAVLRAALANGGIAPHEVSYVEAHGTGTPLGDPIEIQALGAVLSLDRPSDRPLLIGSVKTNIGHLESAAGLAGMIKVILALRHSQIPAHLHFTTPNPHIPWQNLPIAVPTTLTAWPAGEHRRIAGVSSFGFSGTNAHVLIEDAPPVQTPAAADTRPLQLFTLSARSASALRTLALHYQEWIAERPTLTLAELCHTANVGRAQFEHRLAIIAADMPTLTQRLGSFVAGVEDANVIRGSSPVAASSEVAFLFSGHGATYMGMARGLYNAQPVFRTAIDRCAELLQGQIDQPLTRLLGLRSDEIDTAELLSQMAYAQPALFAVQYALAELWKAWGVHPALVAGHSAGEYAAACFAGVFSLEDALRLVVARGRLMQSLAPDGTMVAVFTNEARVRAAIEPYAATVAIAAVNGRNSIVVSGRADDVTAALAPLDAAGIELRPLDISIAAHSPLIDPILDAFTRVAATVQYHPPQIGVVSTLTGELASAEQLCTPEYWRRHLRQPVRFADALHTLIDQQCTAFIEIGPHPTLLGMARRELSETGGLWLPSLRQGHDDWQQILESLAALYVGGAAIDWQAFDQPYALRKVALPTYPFERRRYWAAPARQQPGLDAAARWREVAISAERQATQGPLDLNIGGFAQKWRLLDALATAAIIQALRELNLFTAIGERHTIAEIAELHAITPTYQRLMRRWLGHLADDGLLLRDDQAFILTAPLPDSLAAAQHAAAMALADNQPLLDYALRCVTHLSAVVTSNESALDTLFPAGSYETVDYIYHHWVVARYFNQIVAAAATAVAGANPSRPIRVLEIGAGTGGTAAALLPILPADRVEYHFTDLSDFFLARARERFSEYRFIHYGLLDIERTPQDQGYPAHSFDLIIGANVLHATRNLDQTLQHARMLLASGGVLIAYETTSHPRWFDITTGLIEGWQIFEDSWRDDNPLMTSNRWDAALRANGFEEVLALPSADAAPAVLGQSVLIARAPIAIDASLIGLSHPYVEQIIEHTLAAPAAPEPSIVNELIAALPSERHELLVEFVRQHTTRVLRLDQAQPLERNARLMDVGVDSLMAVELRNRLRDGLGLTQKLPATLIFDHPTIDAIARMLARLMEPADPGSVEPIPTDVTPTDADLITSMSDEEAEALLLRKLVELGG